MNRIASGSLADLLNGAAAAVRAGTVNVISVEAIRERFGDRWDRKRDQVETFLKRAFARLAGPSGVILPLNDVEFITFQPDASAAAAVNLTANILQDTLGFFLGAAAQEDMRIFQVNAFVGGRLEVEALDPARLMAGAAGAPHEPAAVAPTTRCGGDAAPSAAIAHSGPRPLVRLASRGIDVEVATALSPIWNITAGVVASARLSISTAEILPDDGRRPASPASLSPALAAQIALIGLREAISHATVDAEAPLVAIHAPLPLPALSYSSSRYAMLHALRDLDLLIRRRLILEITELPAGFPSGRLAELVSMLSSVGRAVLARAPCTAQTVRHWRDCRLNGVTLDCADLASDDRRLPARLSAFAAAVSESAPRCIAYGLNDRSQLLTAWGAGFSHLEGPALSEVVDARKAVRMGPEDFFASISGDRPRQQGAA